MRLIRIALPFLAAATLAACAGSSGAAASAPAGPAAAEGQAGVTLLNERAALTAMQNNYPPLLRDAQVTGTVEVAVTLDAVGRVSATSLRNSTHHLFEPAARQVAQNLLFTPPAAPGQRMTVRMDFIPTGAPALGRARISIVD